MTNIAHGVVCKIIHDEMRCSKLSARRSLKRVANLDKANQVQISRRNHDRMKSNPENFLITLSHEMKHGFTTSLLKRNKSGMEKKRIATSPKVQSCQKERKGDDINLLELRGNNHD